MTKMIKNAMGAIPLTGPVEVNMQLLQKNWDPEVCAILQSVKKDGSSEWKLFDHTRKRKRVRTKVCIREEVALQIIKDYQLEPCDIFFGTQKLWISEAYSCC